MRFTIDRHPLVESDLERIQDFIAPVAGIKIASRIGREIETRIKNLRDLPHVGTVRSDITPGLRAIPCTEKAVICFTVNDDTQTVRIICVTYAGQDWQSIARSRD